MIAKVNLNPIWIPDASVFRVFFKSSRHNCLFICSKMGPQFVWNIDLSILFWPLPCCSCDCLSDFQF